MHGRALVQALLFTLPLSSFSLSAEEAAPKHVIQPAQLSVVQDPVDAEKNFDRAKRDAIRRLIFAFTADEWQERERAFAQVIEHGQAAIPELEAVLQRSTNPEVTVRSRQAIVAIREAAIRGTFTQYDSRVRDSLGNMRDGDTKEGWFAIGDGKATWYQRFGGTLTAQTYSYDINQPLTLDEHGNLEVKLTYLSIETQIGYTPESLNPKLQFRKNATGELKVTFTGTDGMGQQTTAEFVFAKSK